ncbi:MAG: 3'-5' exonuclease [Planctomycetota bacterium]
MDRPIVVLDTETANVRGAPFLLELGAVRVVEGEVVDQFEEFVLPLVPIEAEATEIHGIRAEHVRRASPARDVLERFVAWLGPDWMCAHNAGFDARVLGFEFARAGLVPPGAPMLDTLKLARRHIPDSPDHKLPTLCQHLDLEPGDFHRALADAVWCWKVLEECARRSGATSPAALMSECGTPVTIPAYLPEPARLSPRLRPLEVAARDGAEVTLLYGGSDAAPARLPVLPRLLYERHKKSYLEAECLQSGLLKTYLLERVQKVEVAV